jgi:hypothetical protein
VFVEGETTQRVDTGWFTLPLAIAGHEGKVFKSAGPFISSEEGFKAAVTVEGQVDPRRLRVKLADFHVLVFLSRYLRAQDMGALCRALRTKGTPIPPAVVTLLQALFDDS